jgi:putative tributyrin esterase
MALIRMNIDSRHLASSHEVGIILPNMPWQTKDAATFYSSGKRYPVLWLLHGSFGDQSDWIRKSRIELYACERDIIVVMPTALNSDYANWPAFGLGYDMERYFTEELMPLVQNWLPASAKREDNFIAGLSMGGSGALKFAFSHPERFAGVAALSPATWDLGELRTYAALPSHEFRARAADGSLELPPYFDGPMAQRMVNVVAKYSTVGDYLASSENLWERFRELVPTGRIPYLYAACGTDDFLFGPFRDFRRMVESSGVRADFEELPGYAHEWRFWDIEIERALDRFGLVKSEA